MNNFSNFVKIDDINDFISPSQQCIKPIFGQPTLDNVSTKDKTEEKVNKKQNINLKNEQSKPIIELQLETDFGLNSTAIYPSLEYPSSSVLEEYKKPDLIKPDSNMTAKVSLSDCLSCSGCLTSAETILLEQQSVYEFEKAIKTVDFELIILTLSVESRASLMVDFGFNDL